MPYQAGPLYLNVLDFGARGNGITDDTPAFQAAIDRAYSIDTPSGGTQNTVIIEVPPATYLIEKTLSFVASPSAWNTAVVLAGASRGPYPSGSGNGHNIPVLLWGSPHRPCIQVGSTDVVQQTQCVSIEDIHIHDPLNTNANLPPILKSSLSGEYVPAICIVNATDCRIRRCSTDNSTKFIVAGYDTQRRLHGVTGRILIEDIAMTTFIAGITIEYAMDKCWLNRIDTWPYGDSNGAQPPSTWDIFSFNNNVGIDVGRCDGLFVSNTYLANCLVGIQGRKSTFADLKPKNSFAMMSNIGVEFSQYGIWAKSTQSKGWVVNGFDCTAGVIGNKNSHWAAFAGDPADGTNGKLVIMGGALQDAFAQSATLHPYSAFSANPYAGPFGLHGGSFMNACFVLGYSV